VVALEVTRLSRNSPDWHHLLYLCRFSETLIAVVEAGAVAAAPPAATKAEAIDAKNVAATTAEAQPVQPKAEAAKAAAPAAAGTESLPPGARFTAVTQHMEHGRHLAIAGETDVVVVVIVDCQPDLLQIVLALGSASRFPRLLHSRQ